MAKKQKSSSQEHSENAFSLDFLDDRDFETNKMVVEEIVGFIKDKSIGASDVTEFEYHGTVFENKVANIVLGLILVPVRFTLDRDLELSDFNFNIDSSSINKFIGDYFDKTIEQYNRKKNINELAVMFTKVLTFNAKVAWDINLSVGNTANIYDMIKLMGKNERVKEILFFESNENNQFKDIEDSVSEQNKELVNILLNESDTCYKNLLPSVSIKQFQQVFTNISLKPDLNGIVIEQPINTSFLRGMRGSTDYFINAIGARKALVTNA